MSVSYIPKLEESTSTDGSIEFSADDVRHIIFKEDKCHNRDFIKRSELLNFGDEGFLLHNVLTAQECDMFMCEGENIGFEVIHGAREEYREMTRIFIQSQELADTLWSRVQHHIQDVVITGDPHKLHIHGPPVVMQGHWTPFALNNNEQSGKYCAEDKNIMCSIQPEKGLAIVFNHHRLHEGAKIIEGQKYILRTDVMYKRVDEKLSEHLTNALACLQQAETLENANECMKAAEMYRKAFKLAPELESSF